MQFNFYVYGKRRPLDTLFPALVATHVRPSVRVSEGGLGEGVKDGKSLASQTV